MSVPARIFLLCVVFFQGTLPSLAAHADPTVVEVIPLRHRTAEQVIPLIQPLVDKQGALSGMNNQLILRTTPANLAQIKEILQKIDVRLRRLRITVRQGGGSERSDSGADVSGRVGVGEHARVTIGAGSASGGGTVEYRRGDDAVRGRVFSSQAAGQSDDTRQIQVLEGNPAWIQTGTSVPLPERTVIVDGRRVRVVEGTSYRDVNAGFYALPRVNGDQVTVDLSSSLDTVSEQGRVNLKRAHTTLSGRLGEWLEVGGIAQSRTEQRAGIGASSDTSSAEQARIFIKVEELN